MTTPDPVVIGELKILGAKPRSSSINVRPGYGITCDEFAAINGSAFLASCFMAMMKRHEAQMRIELSDPTYGVTITLGGEEISSYEAEPINQQLSHLYQLHGC